MRPINEFSKLFKKRGNGQEFRRNAFEAFQTIFGHGKKPRVEIVAEINNLCGTYYEAESWRGHLSNLKKPKQPKDPKDRYVYASKDEHYIYLTFYMFANRADERFGAECTERTTHIFNKLWRCTIEEQCGKKGVSFSYLLSVVDGEDLPATSNSRQPILQIPDPGKGDTHHFISRSLKVVGRDEQKATLKQFAGGGPGFRWMQLAGQGGQGKSRLALDLAISLGNDRHVGFIPSLELKHFQDRWRYWTPDRPTLIIVDDIIADMETLKPLLQYLSIRKKEFAHPVRLLLVERQRWNYSGINVRRNESASSAALEASFGGGLADWFDQLAGREREVVLGARFDPSVIELEPLESDHLVKIVCCWAAKLGATRLPSNDNIKAHLKRIDESGRPLYAYFLAEALAVEQDVTHWKIEDLLRETLNRDIRNRWKHYFGGELPFLEEDHPALRLAALATMTRGVDILTLKDLTDWPRFGPEARRQALAMVDGPIGDASPAKSIPGMLPDILGGWFVLSVVSEEGIQANTLTDAAWRLAPTEVGAFLERVTKDFPNHPGTSLLLEADLPDDPDGLAAKNAVQNAALTILFNLWEAKLPFPSSLIAALQNAAEAGHGLAMTNLGVCYTNGYGVEQDHSKAAHWYRKGADAGSAGAMSYLGVCYAKGYGVEQDDPEAVRWFRNGAAAGDGGAMANLGLSYAEGRGVDQDYYEAVRLYRKGVNAGEFRAMAHLGFCYEMGHGVKQNHAEAVCWYRKGAEAGDGRAMSHLGSCYADGLGVAQNFSEAVRWYRQGADAGDGVAMGNLGFCYAKGRGVEQDYSEAVRWFGNSADVGEGGAMANLGLCYEKGYGVEQDYCEAVRWYRKGADAGDGGAMGHLGSCYADGLGVEQDYSEAVRWYCKGADAGDARSKRLLIDCYNNGRGFTQDLE